MIGKTLTIATRRRGDRAGRTAYFSRIIPDSYTDVTVSHAVLNPADQEKHRLL
jgi:hypothetical protein